MSDQDAPSDKIPGGSSGCGFGTPGGPDPAAAGRKGGETRRNGHSVREEMKKLMREGLIKVPSPEALVEVRNKFMSDGNLKRAAAVQGIIKLFGESFDAMVDNIDGRLASTNVNANMDLDEGDSDAADIAAVKKSLLRGLIPPAPDGGAPTEDTAVDGQGPTQA